MKSNFNDVSNFVVVGKPIPTFLIVVHLNDFDISNDFLTNRQHIARNRNFRRRSHFAAK